MELWWKFTAIFYSSLHLELVQIVNDRLEVSDDYTRGLLDPTIVIGGQTRADFVHTMQTMQTFQTLQDQRK